MTGEKRFGLSRALSKMGYCSRTQAAVLIRAGQVAVNGKTIRDPEHPARMHRDRILVNDAEVTEQTRIYLMMNKPRGVVTTASDEQGRETVYDILKRAGQHLSRPGPSSAAGSSRNTHWIAPVGRLDKASEGLLLLTNDSEWAARITDPASRAGKRYHVQVNCVAGDNLLGRIREGVSEHGEHLRAKAVTVLRQGGKNSWLEITLDEGKNRHIRRMLNALGVEVLRLVRVAIGRLELGDLKKGTVRRLTAPEKAALDVELDEPRRTGRRRSTGQGSGNVPEKTTGACR